MTHAQRRWLLQFAAAFAVWTLLAYFYAFQRVQLAWLMDARRMPLWEALWPAFMTFWVCALLTPAVLEFARCVPFDRTRWPIFAAAHGAGFLAFVALHATLRVLIFSVHSPHTGEVLPRSFDLVKRLALVYSNDDIFFYIPLVAGAIAHAAYRRTRDREIAQSKLEAQLAGAELQILKMQLQPHFLFNTLQAISTLVGKDPAAAKRMISLLGDLLRAVIDRTGEQEVPLREELDLLDRYVQIELVRFGDKLTFATAIEPAALECAVPAMILQPLVENAIRHGARGGSGRGEVRLDAHLAGAALTIEIDDNGPGLTTGSEITGVGLANTRARLTQLYGPAHTLELANRSEGGARVRLTIPRGKLT